MKQAIRTSTSFLAGFFLLVMVTSVFSAKQKLDLDVSLSHPVVLSGEVQKVHLKVGLTGFNLSRKERTPVNICLVLDKSGSMSGSKIARAREAAEVVVNMLNSQDIFSLVVYSSGVETLIPATKLSDKHWIIQKIRAIRPEGSTALFSGVSKGLSQVRKFQSREIVNRVILVSDGLANIGPSSPQELGRLGRSAAKEGISITTIGLGLDYNEDLMTTLASSSDGNHAFVENANDLARIFKLELGDVLSVVAQNVEINIHCAPHIKPIRVLDRDAEIRGNVVILSLNQIYSKQEKFVLIEVEVPKGKSGKKQDVASVEVAYNNMNSQKSERVFGTASVKYSDSKKEVAKKSNKKVQIHTTRAIANEQNKQAIQLRDKGDVSGAQRLMKENSGYLRSQSSVLNAPELMMDADETDMEADSIKNEKSYKKARKKMRKRQYKSERQMSY